MKTDELIAALAADTLPHSSVARRLALALPVALALSGGLFVLFWGLRPDLGAALTSVAGLKTAVPLLVLGCAAMLAYRLVHPGRTTVQAQTALTALAVICGAGLVTALAFGGIAGLRQALWIPSALFCLISIPVLALPLLAGSFWALSGGAALRPRLSGLAAGVMAGSGGAAIYSLYCPQDAALFVLPAYGLAIAALAGLGAWIGPALLKW